MHRLSRRNLLRGVGYVGVSQLLSSVVQPSQLFALTAGATDYKALVCISLDGGCDGNNVFVPLTNAGYRAYATGRKGLALDPSTLHACGDGGGEQYGFHPSLGNISGMYSEGQAAVLANVGTLVQPTAIADFRAGQATVPSSLLDHERQRYEWGTSQTLAGATLSTSKGWGGRVADAVSAYNSGPLPTVTCLAPGTTEQIFCFGEQSYPLVVSPAASGAFPTDASQSLSLIAHMQSGNVMIGTAARGLADTLDQNAVLTSVLQKQPLFDTVFPNTSLGRQLHQVLQMIQARASLAMGRQIFHCVLPGFDNHENQLPAQAAALLDLDSSVAAFYRGLIELDVQNAVTTFTTSDFGRTLCENSSVGSDHAWGNHAIIIGGAVKGGRVYGSFPDLTLGGANDIGHGGWLPTTSVAQYGATLASWFGVLPSTLSSIFPNLASFTNGNLGFI